LRLPEACCTTQEVLTPNFAATSLALTSCRIDRLWIAAGGQAIPWSLPFNRSIVGLGMVIAPNASCVWHVKDCVKPADRAHLHATERPGLVL
jgi:hypothetical protein